MKAVILAGGGGTRLWPLSTSAKPKQFHQITSDKTLLEETVARLSFLKNEDIYIALNSEHLHYIEALCPQIPKENLILEPALRDTAPCLGLAASIIEKRHPNEIMAVIYADHLIQNTKEFQKNLLAAEKAARKHQSINIVEVGAENPDTNYGYVKIGDFLENIDGSNIYHLESFHEKPDLAQAQKYIKSGNYLWNTGIYVWPAAKLLEYFKKLYPKTHQKLINIAAAYDTLDQETVLTSLYPTLEKISIDYAIMEKIPAKEILILKAKNLDWSDIGNWGAIWQEMAQKAESNIQHGPAQLLDCEGCLVYTNTNKKVAAIGLKDIIVVDTPDGLLVCRKDQSKRTKEIS